MSVVGREWQLGAQSKPRKYPGGKALRHEVPIIVLCRIIVAANVQAGLVANTPGFRSLIGWASKSVAQESVVWCPQISQICLFCTFRIVEAVRLGDEEVDENPYEGWEIFMMKGYRHHANEVFSGPLRHDEVLC